MKLLSLDTCLQACSVALEADSKPRIWLTEAMARGHQERLATMTRDVMADGGLAFAELDRIGVTIGPGSFTGLRVGLAFAKGLALALGRPCVGVGVLEALAASLDHRGPLAAVIDAGRGRVYLQIFDAAVAVTAPELLDTGLAITRVAEVCPSGEITLTGPGAPILAPALRAAHVQELAAPDPRAVARLARLAPIVPPRPLYLRAPDAKVKGT